ncbi:uncharacterized protein LOC111056316 [Nilaparvata lugens]|uniref:uncharacterized protein LOC111056316 n=1 Tax=Nilaparvata lugens TaxID=108931 RepID=UPI00193CC29A|nr:uncharacterized protein LOC111056316 [Nilaparvata lugens]
MNGDVDAYNVEEICRLCLKAEGTILPIFGLEHSSRDCIPLSNKIKACVAVEVNRNDELPKKICVGCVHQVDSWHKFKTACDTAQTKLTSWIKTTERYKSATSEIIIKQEPIDDFECDDVIVCDDDSNDTAAPPSPAPIFENPRIDAPESASVIENQDHHEDSNISFFESNARDPLEITPEQSNDAENVGSNVEVQEPPIHGKSLLEQALEGDVVDKPPQQLDEDELMIADFSDELAPDLKLLKGDDVVTQDGVQSDHEIEGLVDENSVASTGCVVKTEEASLIHMIDFEMKRRASEDFDTVEPFVDVGDEEDDYEDYDVGIVVEGSHSQQRDVQVVGMVTRSSRRFDGADVTAGKSENGMMIEAFSLKDDFGGERFEGDPFTEEHERLLNGTAGSNVDPDAMTVNSSITQSDATSMIVKQEPMSPGTVDDYEVSSMSKDDWATDEPTADVDYKPEVDQHNYKKKRKYRRHSYKKGKVPCKPCGGTYPNYLKYIRHCKSLKHQNNVKLFKSLGKPVPEEPILGPPVTPPN